ncbi:MAG: HAD hydrolase-like protein [Eubacteriales bacterium]
MNYRYILFDLDGTIIDSKNGVITAAKFALDKMGVPETKIVDLDRMIGPPLKSSFVDFFGLKDEFADAAVKYFREFYREKAIFDYEVYDGMLDVLNMLKREGYILALATSKPTVFAKRILERSNMLHLFDSIIGANLDDSNSDKAHIISQVIDELNIYNLDQAVMIGDRKYDIYGANAVGIRSIGVLYSYGTFEEMQEAGASYVVNTVEELGNLLYSLKSDD